MQEIDLFSVIYIYAKKEADFMQKVERIKKEEVQDYIRMLYDIALSCSQEEFDIFIEQSKEFYESPIYPLIVDFVENVKKNRK